MLCGRLAPGSGAPWATSPAAHTLGAHGVLRVDFLAGANGRVTMLEANTLPGLSRRGNLATMARAAGIAYPTLIQHVVRTAFTKPGYLP